MVDHDQLIPEEREKENQSLIEDLNHYYGIQGQDSASLAQIRARLLQKTATSLPASAEEGVTRLPIGSRIARREHNARPLSQKRLQRHPSLTNLAVALFLVLLVSSFALVLHLRQGTATVPEVPSIEPGWTLVATFQGTGNKTITGQRLEVGYRFGLLITCANSSDGWVEAAVLPEQSSDGTRCSNVPTSPSGPEGIYSSPIPFPPIQTIKVQTDSSISWQLSIFKGITYPPLSINSKEWHPLQGEVDSTGSGIVPLDLTLPTIWALEYECHGTGSIQVNMKPYTQVGSLSTTIVNDACDGLPHLAVSDTSSSGTFQAVHQLSINTGASNDWQIVLLGCANGKPHCGITSLSPIKQAFGE